MPEESETWEEFWKKLKTEYDKYGCPYFEYGGLSNEQGKFMAGDPMVMGEKCFVGTCKVEHCRYYGYLPACLRTNGCTVLGRD